MKKNAVCPGDLYMTSASGSWRLVVFIRTVPQAPARVAVLTSNGRIIEPYLDGFVASCIPAREE